MEREQELLHHLWQRKEVAGPALTTRRGRRRAGPVYRAALAGVRARTRRTGHAPHRHVRRLQPVPGVVRPGMAAGRPARARPAVPGPPPPGQSHRLSTGPVRRGQATSASAGRVVRPTPPSALPPPPPSAPAPPPPSAPAAAPTVRAEAIGAATVGWAASQASATVATRAVGLGDLVQGGEHLPAALRVQMLAGARGPGALHRRTRAVLAGEEAGGQREVRDGGEARPARRVSCSSPS